MSFFSGLLGGVGTRARELRAESLRQQELADERQRQLLQSIVESDRFREDTGMREAALFGLMDLAQGVKPKRGFLENLLGGAPTTSGSAFQTLDRIAREFSRPAEPEPEADPRETPIETVPFKVKTPPAAATPPPTTASMAPPPGQPGSMGNGAPLGPGGGGPPPAPVSQATGQAGAAPSVTGGGGAASDGPPPMPAINTTPLVFDFPPRPNAKPKTVTTTSKLWKDPIEEAEKKIVAEERARVMGRVAGRVAAGMDQATALELERRQLSGGVAGSTFAEGEITPDPASPTGFSQILYLRSDPTQQRRIPAMAPGARSTAPPNERAMTAWDLFGDQYPSETARTILNVITPAQAAEMEQALIKRAGQRAFSTGTGAGDARVNTELKMPIGIPGALNTPERDPTKPLGALGPGGVGRPLPSTDAYKLSQMREAITDIDTLHRALTGVVGGTGTYAALQAKMPNFVADFTGWGLSAKQRQATVDRVRQVIGKLLEEGVLRKEDEAKYLNILPTMADPQDLATYKMKDLDQKLRADMLGLLTTFQQAGFLVQDIPGPPKGSFVGEPYMGEVKARESDGKPIGLVDGKVVEITFHNGKPYY